ncbi:MAG: VWA domain-containing protein [Desulfurococcales archaeon]|nr:VWA domain-containing protein [Desulfurococcales archaeon]
MYNVGEIIVIIVDESLSMMKTDFKPRRIDVLRESLKPFVRSLLEREIHTLVGLVGFYKIAYPITYPVDNTEPLMEALDTIRIKGEASASGDAVNLASLILFSTSPPGYNKRMILITDDTSNAGIPLSLMSTPLKTSGIKVDVVGLGRLARNAREDLEALASSSNGVFIKVDRKEDLLPSLYKLL